MKKTEIYYKGFLLVVLIYLDFNVVRFYPDFKDPMFPIAALTENSWVNLLAVLVPALAGIVYILINLLHNYDKIFVEVTEKQWRRRMNIVAAIISGIYVVKMGYEYFMMS